MLFLRQNVKPALLHALIDVSDQSVHEIQRIDSTAYSCLPLVHTSILCIPEPQSDDTIHIHY